MEDLIVYPRWIHHATEKPFVVESEEQAKPHYARGFQPWPVKESEPVVEVKVKEEEPVQFTKRKK